MLALVTPSGRSGWGVNAPRAPLLLVSIVDFQTFVEGLPSGPVPPATSRPSETARTAAPVRASGKVSGWHALPAGAQAPSAPDVASGVSAQMVVVGVPSGPEPPIRYAVPLRTAMPAPWRASGRAG